MNPVRNKKTKIFASMTMSYWISNGMKKLLLITCLLLFLPLFAHAETPAQGAYYAPGESGVAAGETVPTGTTIQGTSAAPVGGCNAGKCTYVPLEPLPGVNSTGLNFANYVSGMFRLLISLGALFAVLMLVIGGINYMIADAGVKIEASKERMKAALYGLLLLVACWLILYTINPNLLRFDLFQQTVNTVAQKNTDPGAGAPAVNKNITITPTAEMNAQITQCEASGKKFVPKDFNGTPGTVCE